MTTEAAPHRRSLPTVDVARASTTGRDLDGESAERISVLLKAVADPVRLRLLTRLASAQAEVCVCDFPDMGVSQSTLSHHLKKLREAGLVDCERRGTWVYYRPVREQLKMLHAFLDDLI